MGKSEQTGGGGGYGNDPRKEPKPDAEAKQKRPWSKPRLMFIEMDFTQAGGASSQYADTEATAVAYGGHITGTRYRMS